MKMPKQQSEDEAEFDFEAYAEDLANMVSFMAKSKRFGEKFPKLQARIRDLNRKTIQDLEEDAEPAEEGYSSGPPKTRADAEGAFKRHNAMVLKDVRRRFRARTQGR